jgi:RNA-binding protein
MLTSKQRAFLRSEASKADALFQIGKGGVGDTVMQSVDQALDARELIKLSVLDNSDEDPREAAENMARETGAEVVSVIGRKIILFRESSRKEKRKISERLKDI